PRPASNKKKPMPPSAQNATSSGLNWTPSISPTCNQAGRRRALSAHPQRPSPHEHRPKQLPAPSPRLPHERKESATTHSADARACSTPQRPQLRNRRALRRPTHRPTNHHRAAATLRKSRPGEGRTRHPRLSSSAAKRTRPKFRARKLIVPEGL